MPHLVLDGTLDLGRATRELSREGHRWKTAVLKIEDVWCRWDQTAILVEGVVVEHSRAVHPVAVVAVSKGATTVRLWRHAPVERTEPVQRWLAVMADELCGLGGLALRSTNISDEILPNVELGRRS
jgi:hypothetical protein